MGGSVEAFKVKLIVYNIKPISITFKLMYNKYRCNCSSPSY
jgi:hypothetical protein